GTTKVYATLGAWTDSASVTVAADTALVDPVPTVPPPAGPPVGLRVGPSQVTIAVGATTQLVAWYVDAAGRPTRGPAGPPAQWTSAAPSVARLSAIATPDT